MSIIKLIADYLIISISMVLHLLVYKNLSKDKIKKNVTTLLSVLLCSAILVANNYFASPLLKSIFNFIAMNIMYFMVFKKSIKKTLFIGIVIFGLGIINEVLLSILLTKSGISNLEILHDNFYILVYILTIVNPLILFFVTKIKIINKIALKKKDIKISFIIQVIFYIIFLTAIVCIMVLNLKYVESINARYYLVTGIAILIIFLVIIGYLYSEKCIISTENKMFKQMNDDYIIISDKYRELRHNYINKIMSLKSVANKKTNSLIDEMIVTFNNETKSYDVIKNLPKGIKGIIYQKIYSCELNDINIKVDSNFESTLLNVLTPKKYNALCELLGLALDNALDSLEKVENKLLYIDIFKNKSIINIKIINTFSQEIDLDKIGQKYYTTKKKGNGIGLNYILKSKLIKSNVEIHDNLFILTLSV